MSIPVRQTGSHGTNGRGREFAATQDTHPGLRGLLPRPASPSSVKASVPGPPVLRTLCVEEFVPPSPSASEVHCPHFTGEELEAQRGWALSCRSAVRPELEAELSTPLLWWLS